jgi:Spy/CpxP family protein refolding chaperone
MERKGFLTAAIGAATALAGTALAAAAAPGSVVAPPTMEPRPVASGHWLRGENMSNRNITRIRVKLERVIDELQHDQRDYDGHREKALDLLQRARTELLAAENWDKSHPNG